MTDLKTESLRELHRKIVLCEDTTENENNVLKLQLERRVLEIETLRKKVDELLDTLDETNYELEFFKNELWHAKYSLQNILWAN
jgi:hypothetical protein